MYKLLISLTLLSLPTAVPAHCSDPVARPYRNRGERSAEVGWESEYPAEVGAGDNTGCFSVGGFRFCATKSVLRWHEAPAHHARPSIPLGRWI